MNKVYYSLEKVTDEHTGIEIDTLVKNHPVTEKDPAVAEELLNVMDVERLFDTCVERWGENWDLNKVCKAITECEFD